MPRSPSRGFRLYEIQLYRGQGQTAVPFMSDDLDYAQHLQEIIRTHLLDVRLDRKPRLDAFTRVPEIVDEQDEDEERAASIFEVHDLRPDGRQVALTYRAGSIGSFRWAVPPGEGEPVDVSGHAVTNEQRAFFLLPPAGETTGVLLAESAGRATGEHALHRWLHAASKATNGGTAPYWRLALDAVADPEHVRQLLDEDSLQEVVLSRREETTDRSTTVEPFTIRAPLRTQYSRRQTADVLRGWANRDRDPLSVQEGAQQLAAIIDRRFRDVSFDDGYVRARGEQDSGQHLRPDLAKDIFTYSLGSGWHSDAAVLRAAAEVAERLHGLSDLDLPWT